MNETLPGLSNFNTKLQNKTEIFDSQNINSQILKMGFKTSIKFSDNKNKKTISQNENFTDHPLKNSDLNLFSNFFKSARVSTIKKLSVQQNSCIKNYLSFFIIYLIAKNSIIHKFPIISVDTLVI